MLNKYMLIVIFIIVFKYSSSASSEDKIIWSKIGVNGYLTSYSFSDDGKYFAITDGSSVAVINVKDYKIVQILSFDSTYISPKKLYIPYDVDFIPGTYHLAVSISGTYTNSQINFYNLESRTLIKVLPYWDPKLEFTKDAKIMCLWNSYVNLVRLIDIESAKIIYQDSLPIIDQTNKIGRITISKDNNNICVVTKGGWETEIFILNINSKEIIWNYQNEIDDVISDATFLNNDEIIITGLTNIYRINFKTNSLINKYENPNVLKTLPDSKVFPYGDTIITRYTNDIYIRNIKENKFIKEINVNSIADNPFQPALEYDLVFFDVFPNGKNVVTLTTEGILVFWNVFENKNFILSSGNNQVRPYIEFLDNDAKIMERKNSNVFIWDVENGEKIKYFGLSCPTLSDKCIGCLNKSPSIIYQNNEKIEFYNIELSSIEKTIEVFKNLETNKIVRLIVSPQDSYTAIVTEDSSIYLIDNNQEIEIIVDKLSAPISYISFTNDEMYLVLTLQGSYSRLYDIKNKKIILNTSLETIKNIFLIEKNNFVGIDNSNPQKIIFFNPFNNDKIEKRYVHLNDQNESLVVFDFEITKDEKFLLSATSDYCINIWDMTTDSIISKLKFLPETPVDILISDDNSTVISSLEYGSLVVWNTKNILTDIEEDKKIEQNKILCYPNPAQDNVYISSSTYMIKSILIYNLLGEPVFNYKRQFHEINIDVSSFNSNLYLVNITTENNKIFLKKIIIRR